MKRHEGLAGPAGHANNERQIVHDFLKEMGEPLPRPLVNGAIARIEERLQHGEIGSLQPVLRLSHATSDRRLTAWVSGVIVAGLAVAALMLPPPLNSSVVAKADSGGIYIAPLQKLVSRGFEIEAGQAVRSGADGAAVVLQDRSRIEMSADSELSVVNAEDGMRVRLASGSVIVTAAKQRRGHLYVETRDLLISVIGTVFSVSAESTGSRVSVIEGEVRVQKGQTEQTLLPGQQASTSLALGPMPVESDIGWSKNARTLVALLQQSPPLVPPPPRQDGTNIVTGVVKRASNAEPISGLAISLCPPESGKVGAYALAVQPNPDLVGEVRRILQPSDVNLPVLNSQDGAGPIIKNKTFFFQLFDSVTCRNPISSTTDSVGRFRFADLTPGQYTIRVEGEGYFGAPTNGEYPPTVTQRITIAAQQTLPELTFSMIHGGIIAGRIRDTEGKLVSNVTIAAGKVMEGGRFRTIVSKSTDDRGEYRLFWLPPGEYNIAIGADEAQPSGILLHYIRASSMPVTGMTFYPNATTVADAQTVTVKEGDEVPGVDMLLRR